jgi:RNA polymerase-associated protein CTR9
LQESPGYIDCYLRLACAAHKKGNPAKAIEWAQKALDQAGEDTSHAADAMALMSQLHMEQR